MIGEHSAGLLGWQSHFVFYVECRMTQCAFQGCAHQQTVAHALLNNIARMFRRALPLLALLPVVFIAAPSSFAQGVGHGFSFPVKCEYGSNCVIQNYFDHNSTSGMADYACGSRTYDGHDGTHIRLPNLEAMKKGFQVVAAAAGKAANPISPMNLLTQGLLWHPPMPQAITQSGKLPNASTFTTRQWVEQ